MLLCIAKRWATADQKPAKLGQNAPDLATTLSATAEKLRLNLVRLLLHTWKNLLGLIYDPKIIKPKIVLVLFSWSIHLPLRISRVML